MDKDIQDMLRWYLIGAGIVSGLLMALALWSVFYGNSGE